MADVPYAKLLGEMEESLAPLLRFVFDSAFAQRQGDPAISDFVFGNPHDMPIPAFTEALGRWLEPKDKDWFAYRLNEDPARAAVAASLREITGLGFDGEDVFLTPGAFGALSVALRTICDPTDEVVFVSPPWFFYEPMIRVAGAVPVRVVSPPPVFDLPLDAIASAIGPRTRGIIVNSPNNPSGRIYTGETLRALGALLAEASERNGRTIYLLSDESYRRIVFDGRAFVPPAVHYPATLVIYTYGKTLLAPGQRLGYLAVSPSLPGREEIRRPMLLAQIAGGWQFPNAVLQYALPDLEPLSIDVGRLQRRRDRLVGALSEMGYEVVTPEGTFYVLVRSPLEDDEKFTDLLAERDVFVLPGRVFEVPGWFRISVTASDEMVERSLPGFAAAIERARA